MAKHVFFRLSIELQTCCGLRSTKFVTADKKLATFLHFACIGCGTRVLQERFQRSAETIQNSIYSTLACLVGPFYTKHLHLPSNDSPPEIKKEPKFYPYFRNCRGAIDVSHFHAWVLLEAMACYRNLKGFIG
ncbi:hypothetical protein DFH08DRAFT_693145 [Mycena albidolilacea]|uniref:DUF8040 domain-containing protein n=1 Tax=Mycena albidolilacea TaxID=1033008 RepID=A0AAD7A977_9AGAR|nr:hypothetical protein DFH08DRAFT_693145 [Mycena albidolilacea]